MAAVALVVGVGGLGASLVGVATQLLPRQFTARQQQQIIDWEVGKRWRVFPAGKIFPASVRYPLSAAVFGDGVGLTLTASRIGIARQATCPAATDAVIAAVLARDGCQAMLRATYADATDSYVVTVGVAVFGTTAEASAAQRELAATARASARHPDLAPPGVLPVRFAGTPAAWFTSSRRQLSASTNAGTYVVFYTVGYADQRPLEPVAADSYVDSELTSLGVGVARAVVSVLAAPLPRPHCPGTPGC